MPTSWQQAVSMAKIPILERSIEDKIYEELTQAMTSVNVEAEDLHATAAHAFT